MKHVVSGIVAGALVFFLLLAVFGGGTGPVELVLWVVLAVLAGVIVTKLLQLGEKGD